MTTDTRSVAEILGWQLGHEKRWTCDDETWYFIPDECDADGEPATRLGGPTVDDMLAWLSVQEIDGEDVLIDIDAHEAPDLYSVDVLVWDGDVKPDGDYRTRHRVKRRPTLHAALEAAVRAVAAS